jgi:hypothetical protein
MALFSCKDQPWLGKPITDIVFILLPPFASLIFIFLFPSLFQNNKKMSEHWWLFLILLVDVAHVYSTLYRTYFNRNMYRKQKTAMLAVPLIAFVGGLLLYSISFMAFWRVLAYLAVFHFVRQQYGFMRLYSRKESNSLWMKRVDTITIYYATLYPLIYWHCAGPRNFNWFVEGDFVLFSAPFFLLLATVIYLCICAVYLFKEVYLYAITRTLNIPRIAVILGTLLSWYFGIVYFNGDMAYTVLNVVSHGIPYMALIWIAGRKQDSMQQKEQKRKSLLYGSYGLLLFLGLIFLLAYVEEGLWDAAVWKEHKNLFPVFRFASIAWDSAALTIIVPLLALPQITHYILDGFIWKVRSNDQSIG